MIDYQNEAIFLLVMQVQMRLNDPRGHVSLECLVFFHCMWDNVIKPLFTVIFAHLWLKQKVLILDYVRACVRLCVYQQR